MSTRIVCIFVLSFGMVVTAAYAQDTRPQQPIGPSAALTQNAPQLQSPGNRYRLGPGDVVDLTFPFTPEFNQTVTVNPDGFVTLQVLGDVKASGLTTEEFRSRLEKDYSVALKDPVIGINLKEFEKPAFTASGEIGKPGKYDMREGLTLSQAVAIAGGLTIDGKQTQVLVFRRASNEWVEVKTVDLKKLLNGKQLTEDFEVKPGDMIYVPKRKIAGLKPFMPLGALRLAVYPF